jgi:PAS domain S-box-containing protein
MNEETAVACMKAGASDYLLKERIARLPLAVRGAIESRKARQEMETALRASEENFRRSMDESPLGLRIVSQKGETLYANRAVLEIFGYGSSEEFCKTPITQHYSEQSLAEYRSRREERQRGGAVLPEYEIDIVRKDGETRSLHVWRKRVLWDGKEHFQVIYRDVTEHRRADRGVKRQNVYLRALNEIALGLMTRMELKDLLQTIIVRGAHFVGAEEGWVCIYESQSGDFEYKAAIGKGEYRIGERFESGRGIAGEVWRTGRTVVVDDYHEWPGRAQVKGYALRRSTVAVPLKYGDRLAGILGLAHYDPDRRFEEEDLAMLERLAELASIALDNTGLYEQMKQELSQRRQAEEALLKTTERLRRSLAGTVQAISIAVEAKDPYTAGHQRRTADLARAIAVEMGFTADRIDFVRIATTIHDIGKISVPAEILSKPTRLRPIEYALIKSHSQAGYDILKDIEFPWPVAEVVLQHHERMDGSGYPQGLKGEEILLEARIVSVADVVEAIASHRPYRPALGIETALEEIQKNRGALYDPEVTDACLKLFREKRYVFN